MELLVGTGCIIGTSDEQPKLHRKFVTLVSDTFRGRLSSVRPKRLVSSPSKRFSLAQSCRSAPALLFPGAPFWLLMELLVGTRDSSPSVIPVNHRFQTCVFGQKPWVDRKS